VLSERYNVKAWFTLTLGETRSMAANDYKSRRSAMYLPSSRAISFNNQYSYFLTTSVSYRVNSSIQRKNEIGSEKISDTFTVHRSRICRYKEE